MAATDDVPSAPTVGDLRRALAEQGAAWTVDEGLVDSEPLPNFPPGTSREYVDEIVAQARGQRPRDIDTRIREVGPPHGHLAARWVAEGLLQADEAERLGQPAEGPLLPIDYDSPPSEE
jgi:hypothetical protein